MESNTVIAKVLSKSYSDKPDFETTFIFNDEFYESIKKDSSFENADNIFTQLGKPEYVGKFGNGIGFASMDSFQDYRKGNRVIEIYNN